MQLTAEQAKKRILSGNIEGNHEVTEDLDMSGCNIPAWPHWKFQSVNLCGANIKQIGGSFTFLVCYGSTLEEIDPNTKVGKDASGNSANFNHCTQLLKVRGSYAGFTDWSSSGIREIDPQTQFGINKKRDCACFMHCQQLQRAQGVFPGYTVWVGSGIMDIDQKTHLGVNLNGCSANFGNCKNLCPTSYAAKPKGEILGHIQFIPKPTPLPDMEF